MAFRNLLLNIIFASLFASNLFSVKPMLAQEVKIEYPYKNYTVQDGLVQMQVQSLFQDSRGYLWCGTKTGISRFDGRNFKNYSGLEIKQNGPVVFFGEDKNNNILIFNKNNISVLLKDSVLNLDYPNGYSFDESINKIENRSLAFIQKKATNKSSKTNVLVYENTDSLYIESINISSKNRIICFDQRDKNHLWVSNSDSILLLNLKSEKIIDSYLNIGITNLKYLGDTLFGITMNNNIVKLSGDTFELIPNAQLEGNHTKVFSSPDNKSLIIITDDNLYLFKEKLILVKKDLTLIRDILFDNEGNLWVATEEGLYNFFQLNFVNYSFGMGNKDWVWSILEDNEKNMWFSSFQNGIWKWDGRKVTDYTQHLNKFQKQLNGTLHPYSYFMGASKFGKTLYFPTNYNVLKYNGVNFSSVKGIANETNKAYFITKTDSNGTLYCGGMSGLFEISKNGNIRSWTHDSIGISTILSVEIDSIKKITAVGSSGIAEIKKDTIIYRQKGLAQKNYCSTKDHFNNIWIGGNQHLSLLLKDTLLNIVGNSSELYFSLQFVKPHYLLLGGLNGLYFANLNDYYNHNIFEPILYNQNNGFTGIECGQNGFFIDSQGFVWINTSDKVTRFDPKKLINKKTSSPFLYLDTQTSSDNIKWKTLSPATNQKLKYNQNNFKFRFDAVSFTNAGNIRYYHHLVGLQEDWSEASSTNEVNFYHLLPGKYSLLVRVDSGTSDTMSETVTVNFEIEKPYWQTWWFISCIFLLLVLTIIAIIKILNSKFRKQELIKEKIVQLRADALKSQMNPHLIYNALNNINGLINLGEKRRAQNYLNTFSDMLRLVLDSTNKHEITLNHELEITKSFVEFHRQAKNDLFSFEINSELNIDSQNILIPPVIIQPYVENAILHGFSGLKSRKGFIKISVRNKNNRLIISVQDNGIGMGNSTYNGNGLGTKLTQERIKLLEKKSKNQVQIIKLEQGAKIVINIPLKLVK